MTNAQLLPALIVPLVAWRIYLRIRRNIGRQPFKPGRLTFGIGFWSLLIAMVVAGAIRYPNTLLGLGAGLVIGVPLAVIALRLTRYEFTPEGNFYTPNTIIGLTVTLLFLSRLAYRITMAMSVPAADRLALGQSSLTLFFFGITAGYYIAYYAGVLRRGRKGA